MSCPPVICACIEVEKKRSSLCPSGQPCLSTRTLHTAGITTSAASRLTWLAAAGQTIFLLEIQARSAHPHWQTNDLNIPPLPESLSAATIPRTAQLATENDTNRLLCLALLVVKIERTHLCHRVGTFVLYGLHSPRQNLQDRDRVAQAAGWRRMNLRSGRRARDADMTAISAGRADSARNERS